MARSETALADFIGGVVAAEGTFVRSPVRSAAGAQRPTFTFAVAMGAADAETCELLRAFLGVGQVRTYERRAANHDDTVVYAVRSISVLVDVIVPFMDEHLPPSHKRAQYLAWRQQLLDYDRVRRGRRR